MKKEFQYSSSFLVRASIFPFFCAREPHLSPVSCTFIRVLVYFALGGGGGGGGGRGGEVVLSEAIENCMSVNR